MQFVYCCNFFLNRIKEKKLIGIAFENSTL